MKLNNLQVGLHCVGKNISTVKQLYAEASQRQKEGEYDLALFLMNNSEAKLAEMIYKAWMLHNAEKIISDESKSRMERLAEAFEGKCVAENCTWLASAKEVLALNNIPVKDFANAIYDCLHYGRQKFRNIMLVGPSNTAKTFLLKPLQTIFGGRLFENPAQDRFCWGKLLEKQVILLQDFRYHKDIIPWAQFLLMLEGETCHLPVPKNISPTDIELSVTNDIPILATSLAKIEYSRFHPNYQIETDMMDSRWKVIEFAYKFEGPKRKKIDPCGRCFAELISSR